MIYNLPDSLQNLPERCQIVVVGSGAGGAVLAAELSAAGYEVVVLEEGGYYPTSRFGHDPLRMLPRLYRHAGGDSTIGRPGVLFTEGRCVGGGTVVNAGICYRTPPEILHRWAMVLGSVEFLPEHMDGLFRRVEERLHITEVPESLESQDTRLMKKAAEALQYHYVRVKRNIHECMGTNLCIMGCPTSAKQSTLVSYLPEAERHGVRIYSHCRVKRLILDGARATGVEYQIRNPVSGRIYYHGRIRADHVFLAAGAMQTPALLYRSGVARRLKAVGKSLYLHPNVKVIGIFDTPVHGWQGSIQSIQIDHFAEEGFTFGSTFLPPGILALSLPFFGREMDRLMEQFNALSVWGVLIEDSHPGRLYFTPGGHPLAYYKITRMDKERALAGTVKLAQLFFAAGVREVILPIRHFEHARSPDDLKRLMQADIKTGQLNLISVHLMGTCRMGRDPKTSVVDLDHRVHGLQNVYIADASIFPGPIRVNPMVTIMALATRAAQCFAGQREWVQRAA